MSTSLQWFVVTIITKSHETGRSTRPARFHFVVAVHYPTHPSNLRPLEILQVRQEF
jgi:hypothetical protein